MSSHSPHGECGLKLGGVEIDNNWRLSLPAWGVWIETQASIHGRWLRLTSLPAWGVWIETLAKSA